MKPRGKPGVPDLICDLADRAGIRLGLPGNVQGTCCGLPFKSGGLFEAYESSVRRMFERCWAWSDHGKRALVLDTSPCTATLRSCKDALLPEQQRRYDDLRILDSIEFAQDALLAHLGVRRQKLRVALHPVCSLRNMGLVGTFEKLAKACAETVVIPHYAGCCGMGGDRGLKYPQLTDSALREEAREVRNGKFDLHCSSALSCELGLSNAVEEQYVHLLYLLELASR